MTLPASGRTARDCMLPTVTGGMYQPEIVGTGLGLTASYDGLPLSRRPHLQVRGLDELLEMLGDADGG